MRRAPRGLKLPLPLIPETIRSHVRKPIEGTWYTLTPSGHPVLLPGGNPSRSSSRFLGRYDVPGVKKALYVASSQETCLHESWTPSEAPKGYEPDLHEVSLRLGKIFVIDSKVRKSLHLDDDCFRLASPPDPNQRNYFPSQTFAFMVWSAGFDGIMWPSLRYAGFCMAIWNISAGGYVDIM